MLHLHFYAKEDAEHRERRFDQMSANRPVGGDETMKNSNSSFARDRFPVSRLDPPHSDVTVPRSHDAIAYFWEMEPFAKFAIGSLKQTI